MEKANLKEKIKDAMVNEQRTIAYLIDNIYGRIVVLNHFSFHDIYHAHMVFDMNQIDFVEVGIFINFYSEVKIEKVIVALA